MSDFEMSDEEEDMYENYVRVYNDKREQKTGRDQEEEEDSSPPPHRPLVLHPSIQINNNPKRNKSDSDLSLCSVSDEEDDDPIKRLKKPIFNDSFDELTMAVNASCSSSSSSRDNIGMENCPEIQRIRAIKRAIRRSQIPIEEEVPIVRNEISSQDQENQFYCVIQDLKMDCRTTIFLNGNEPFETMMKDLVVRWGCRLDQVMLTVVATGERLYKHQTPLSCNMDKSKTIILSALQLAAPPSAPETGETAAIVQNGGVLVAGGLPLPAVSTVENPIILKWQWQVESGRRKQSSITETVSMDCPFADIKQTLSKKLNQPVYRLRMFLDGDELDDKKSPRDLELNDEDCIDLVIG